MTLPFLLLITEWKNLELVQSTCRNGSNDVKENWLTKQDNSNNKNKLYCTTGPYLILIVFFWSLAGFLDRLKVFQLSSDITGKIASFIYSLIELCSS